MTYLFLFIGLAAAILFVLLKTENKSGIDADPIDEAEVYLAYGRKKQAIEILEKAKLAYPNRTDIRTKLDELRIKN
jgi:Tfp pilus assembly protein FimV